MMLLRVAAGGWLIAVAGTAQASERMHGFAALAATTDQVDMTGIGWGERGRFRLSSGAEGRFARRSGTREVNGEVDRAGGVSFSVSGGALSGTLSGECRFTQNDYRDSIGRLTTTVAISPFAFRCRFSRSGRPAGELRLDGIASRGITVKLERAGWVTMGGTRLALRSVHRFARSPLPTALPIGYVMGADAQPLAAVDLGGTRRRLLLPRDPEQRDAALAAGLALALLWDPGDND